ncbi:Prefoldin-domain-containing protein [Phellopilus nigrolimitatus]|nr:Prefoldin-domain-containing protein [Phellopilus nigrolimitatus]
MSASAQPQTINVADLDVAQLRDVRRQLEEELQHLTGSFQQLKAAQAKFRSCLENVAEVKPANKGAFPVLDNRVGEILIWLDVDRTILVPLTNSLYVPGKLRDPDNVIVDVGTGYFVKKSRADATKHYNSKIDYVRENLEKLQETLSKKQDNLQYVANIMVAKEQGAAAAGGKEAAS